MSTWVIWLIKSNEKSATHVNAKMFYNEREFRSWYFDVNCDKMQFKPITRRLLYLKRKYFYGCQKVSFKICHCLCVVVICSPYKGKVNFSTASDDFKSMMQTIKYSRLGSTTQQINSKSLVHLSHLKQQITKLSQKSECHWPTFSEK